VASTERRGVLSPLTSPGVHRGPVNTWPVPVSSHHSESGWTPRARGWPFTLGGFTAAYPRRSVNAWNAEQTGPAGETHDGGNIAHRRNTMASGTSPTGRHAMTVGDSAPRHDSRSRSARPVDASRAGQRVEPAGLSPVPIGHILGHARRRTHARRPGPDVRIVGPIESTHGSVNPARPGCRNHGAAFRPRGASPWVDLLGRSHRCGVWQTHEIRTRA
jgi:hypothetical protein